MLTSIYRERFAATLAHQPVDRCPRDLAGTSLTTLAGPGACERLAQWLGFTGAAPDDYGPFDRRILEHWDIDFRRCGGLPSFATGRERRISDIEFADCYGIIQRYTGLYWEMVGGPLYGADKDAVAAYQFPTIEQLPVDLLDGWAARARALYTETPYVVVGEHPVLGVLELACWLCGYEHLMTMLALDPEFAHLLFGKILAFQKMVIREYYGRLGSFLHMTSSGDDFGTQRGLLISVPMWREFVRPYMQDRIAYTARFTDAAYMHHSCGAIFDLVPDLTEIGVRILNPIQPAAAGMQARRLKECYGQRIVFHGGLDTQQVLPSNDPRLIGEAVRDLLEAMHPWRDGGFIFAPAHNIQPDVSPAAIAAMYDAVRGQRGARMG